MTLHAFDIPSTQPSYLMSFEEVEEGQNAWDLPLPPPRDFWLQFAIDLLLSLRSYSHCFHLKAQIMMSSVYAMLGFIAFALAFSIPELTSHAVVILLDWPSSVKTVHGVVSGRGINATATTLGTSQASPKAISISISSTNTAAQGPASSPPPSQVALNLQLQPRWSPRDISNISFGLVASLLGVITVVLTYRRVHRRSPSQRSGLCTKTYRSIIKLLIVWSIDESVELGDVPVRELLDESIAMGDIRVFQPSDSDGTLSLEDLPPAYTAVEVAAGTTAQQHTALVILQAEG